jgi:DNA polymerase-3 subunit alpha
VWRFGITAEAVIPTKYIDTDIDGRARDKVINWLITKYGKNHVSYVGTHSEYSAKSAIRDLGGVHEVPSSESFKCTKSYSSHMSVRENMRTKTEAKEYFNKYPQLIDRVDRMSGTISNLGIHPGGVIITDDKYPIPRFCALQRPQDDGFIATMWDKKEIEKLGFIKYDILGINTCAQAHRAMKIIGAKPYWDPPEEPEVFQDVVLNLKNKNIFQFETYIGQKAFQDLMPMSISDVANASGIIRILGTESGRQIYNQYKNNVQEFQQGNVDFWKEQLRDEIMEDHNYQAALKVLSDSYGVLIFQEQLANLVSEMSGGKLSFGKGNVFRKLLDTLHRDCGNLDDNQGNVETLKVWHTRFIEILKEYVFPYLGKDMDVPGVKDFINFKLTQEHTLVIPKIGIIAWMISAAAYLFNKSHAVAYSVNTYNMMWLKHHYPLEFWSASLQLEEESLDKVRDYTAALKVETDIKMLPPNVNESEMTFIYDKKKNTIRYGLRAILSLGDSAEVIVNERILHGKYKDINDFITRLTKTKVNKKTITHLLFANAFSDFGSISEVHKQLLAMGKEIDDIPESSADKANMEAKLLGTNITFTHPVLDKAAMYLPLTEIEDGQNNIVAMKVVKSVTKQTKTGKNYKMLKVQCLNSGLTVNLFDWANREVTEEYLIARVGRKGDFYQLFGPSTQKPFFKNKAKKALRG